MCTLAALMQPIRNAGHSTPVGLWEGPIWPAVDHSQPSTYTLNPSLALLHNHVSFITHSTCALHAPTLHCTYSPLHTTHGTLFPVQVSLTTKSCGHNLSFFSEPLQFMFVCRKWRSVSDLSSSQCCCACPSPSCRHKT